MKLLLLGTALVTSPNNISALELELKPIADLPQSFQTARVCFIADIKCLEGTILIDPEVNRCEKNHFSYNSTGKCPLYHHQETCLWDGKYIKCDGEKWCRDHGYTFTKTNCITPKYLSDICPNNLGMYKECIFDPKVACEQENPAYVEKCQNGWKLDDERLCTYSPLYGICCNKCDSF